MLKQAIFSILDILRVPELTHSLLGRKPRIILYHGVFPTRTHNGIFNYRKKFITPEAFRAHLTWIRRHYTVMPLSSLIERLEQKKGIPPRALAITFDDGYENFYHHAYPLLIEFGFSATVFLATDLVDKQTPLWVDRLEYAIGHTTHDSLTLRSLHKGELSLATKTYADKIKTDAFVRDFLKQTPDNEKEDILSSLISQCGAGLTTTFKDSPYQGLSWDHIREMSQHGIDFAPHTCSHPILAQMDAPEITKEIETSQNIIREHASSDALTIFAYPNGQENDRNEDTTQILKTLQFKAALTTEPGAIKKKTDLYALPRFSLDGTDNMMLFRLTITGVRATAQHVRRLFSVTRTTPKTFFHETAQSYKAEYTEQTPEGFSFRERKEFTLAMLSNPRDLAILDIGSGPGVIIQELLDAGASLTAVDIAPAMIELLKKDFQHPRLTAEVGDIEHLAFEEKTFDRVVALGVLEYLHTDHPSMQETFRVLKTNGEAIISFPNQWSPWRIWNRILLALFKYPWQLIKRILGRPTHPVFHREYSRKEIRALAAQHGFIVEEIAGYNFKLMPLPLDRIFSRLTVSFTRMLSPLSHSRFQWLATAYLARIRKQ